MILMLLKAEAMNPRKDRQNPRRKRKKRKKRKTMGAQQSSWEESPALQTRPPYENSSRANAVESCMSICVCVTDFLTGTSELLTIITRRSLS